MASVNYEKVCKTWTQEEILECLTERENKLRLAAKYDEKGLPKVLIYFLNYTAITFLAFTLFSQAFVEFSFPQEYLSLEQFEKFLIKIEISNATTKCQRLFRCEKCFYIVSFVL